MRKFMAFVFITLAVLLSACDYTDDIPVARVAFGGSASLDLNCGAAGMVMPTVSPLRATDKALVWTSEDEEVASVDRSSGVITALAAGSTFVEARSVSNPDAFARLKVNCIAKADFNSPQIKVYDYLTKTQSAALESKTIMWKDDAGILNFKEDGSIIPVGVGETVVRAFDAGALSDVRGGLTDNLGELLNFKMNIVKLIDCLSFRQPEYIIGAADLLDLSGELVIEPADANDKRIVWESSNQGVANVDSEGMVKPSRTGKTTITATAANGGQKAECVISVIVSSKLVSVESLSFDISELLLCMGESDALKPIAYPSDANTGIVWSVGDERIASIDAESGIVTAVGAGETEITISSAIDESIFAKCSVRVLEDEGGFIRISGTEGFSLRVMDGTYGWNSSGKIEYCENPRLSDAWKEWDGSGMLTSYSQSVGTSGDAASDYPASAKSMLHRRVNLETEQAESFDHVLYLRGSGLTFITKKAAKKWVIEPVDADDGSSSLKVSVSGDMRCLLNHKSPNRAMMSNSCFAYMFCDCPYLTSVPMLLFEHLSESCYESMFEGCVSLSSLPVGLLTSKNLAKRCYSAMFRNCSGLETPCALPSLKLAESCYESMFCGCAGMTAVPVLAARNLVKSCYREMFSGCDLITVYAGDEFDYGELTETLGASTFIASVKKDSSHDMEYYADGIFAVGECPLKYGVAYWTGNDVVISVTIPTPDGVFGADMLFFQPLEAI